MGGDFNRGGIDNDEPDQPGENCQAEHGRHEQFGYLVRDLLDGYFCR